MLTTIEQGQVTHNRLYETVWLKYTKHIGYTDVFIAMKCVSYVFWQGTGDWT